MVFDWTKKKTQKKTIYIRRTYVIKSFARGHFKLILHDCCRWAPSFFHLSRLILNPN